MGHMPGVKFTLLDYIHQSTRRDERTIDIGFLNSVLNMALMAEGKC